MVPVVSVGAMQRIFVTHGFIYVVPKNLFDRTVIQLPGCLSAI